MADPSVVVGLEGIETEGGRVGCIRGLLGPAWSVDAGRARRNTSCAVSDC